MRSCAVWVIALLASGCSDEYAPSELPDCAVWVTKAEISFTNVDRVDVLFVIDASPSMAEEQAALQRQLPAMMQWLAAGTRPDGERVEPVRDLHVAVVSGDLGRHGLDASVPGCGEPLGGDGAVLLHAPVDGACRTGYPSFLQMRSVRPSAHPLVEQVVPDASGIASDLACIGALGSGGCAYSQPLEAALAALWPPLDPDGAPDDPDRITFVGGLDGRGADQNADFLRSDLDTGLSLIVVVVISDQDDCSAKNLDVLEQPEGTLQPAARCATQQAALYTLGRYSNGLRALRPGTEQLVMFAAITGVPVDVTDSRARESLAFGDPRAHDAFYQAILDHPRMQLSTSSDGSLAAACDSPDATASPAPRLVEVAKSFGSNGTVRSICEADWTQIFGDLGLGVQSHVSHTAAGLCLPRPLPRDEHGLVPCTVTWELPRPDPARPDMLVSCDERPELSPHPDRPVGARGGALCVMRQVVVSGLPNAPRLESAAGWFYDDFSTEPQQQCTTATKQALYFTPSSPPNGVSVAIECVDERVADGGPGTCGSPSALVTR